MRPPGRDFLFYWFFIFTIGHIFLNNHLIVKFYVINISNLMFKFNKLFKNYAFL
jgi:hypothetical protein